ncbi:MAG: ClpX C4-type zinc finger protein [Treponema sp.]|nr:ClpX C4-type zinc finger protein [Treponema sp.]
MADSARDPRKPAGTREEGRCSFCGRPASLVRALVAGPPDASGRLVFICDDCVDVCVRVLVEAGEQRWIVRPVQKGEGSPEADPP